MSIAEKLNTIAQNVQKVYDAGYNEGDNDGYNEGYNEAFEVGRTEGYTSGYSQSELDFWNGFIADKTKWDYLFYGWGNEYIRPPFVITGSTTRNIRYAFQQCPNLFAVEKAYFDFSNIKVSDTDLEYAHRSTFANSSNLRLIEDIGLPAAYYDSTFRNDGLLKTIEVLRSNKETMYSSPFLGCPSLVDILNIEGEIGQNGFNVSYSPLLSHDTLMRIINALTDYSTDTSGTSHTITLGATNLAKLTDAEKAIATQKGWTLA